MIAGIVSYLIAYTVTKALDYGSAKTGGLFGQNSAHEDVEQIDGPKAREQTFRIHANKVSDDSSQSSDDARDAKVCPFKPKPALLDICLSSLHSISGFHGDVWPRLCTL